MKRLIVIFLVMLCLSSCYTVVRVGNCKYYTPRNTSSKGKIHHLIYF